MMILMMISMIMIEEFCAEKFHGDPAGLDVAMTKMMIIMMYLILESFMAMLQSLILMMMIMIMMMMRDLMA